MTVSTNTSTVSYNGDGVTTVLAVPFYFLANSQLEVQQTNNNVSPPVTTTLVLGTNYTVSGALNEAGGSVTLTVAAPTGYVTAISRNVPATQLVHYVPNDPFPASTHEQALDQLTMLCQQLLTALGYTVSLPASASNNGVSSVLPYPLPSQFLAWDPTGKFLTNASPTGVGPGTIFDSMVASAAAINASKMSFQQIGAGAVVRTGLAKMQEVPSAVDFGADATGATDCSAALLAQQTSFGFATLPPGTYKVGTNTTLTGPLQMSPGAVLQPSSGVTLTVNGPIIANDHQIFSKSLGGSFALGGEARFVRAAWFGLAASASAAANSGLATSNGTAFTAMLSALDGNGYQVQLPVGYVHTNGFTCNTNGITFIGSYGATYIVNNSTNQPAFQTNSGSVFSVNYEDMKFGQASTITAVSGNCAIYSQAIQSYYRDISISNYPGAPYNGIVLNQGSGAWLNVINISNCLNDGVWMAGGVSDVFMNGVYSNANGAAGFHFTGASGIYGTNVNGYGNGTHAFFFDNIGSVNQFIFGQAWVGDTSGFHNWNCLNLSDSSFSDCWGSTQKSTSVNTNACGLNVTSSNCFNVTFTGFRALTNNGNGVVIDNGADSIQLIGCLVRNSGRGGLGLNQNGVQLGFTAAVNNCELIGLRCKSNPAYGIFCGAFASDYNIISSCNTQSNSVGGLSNGMTGTHNQVGTGANV